MHSSTQPQGVGGHHGTPGAPPHEQVCRTYLNSLPGYADMQFRTKTARNVTLTPLPRKEQGQGRSLNTGSTVRHLPSLDLVRSGFGRARKLLALGCILRLPKATKAKKKSSRSSYYCCLILPPKDKVDS